MADIADIGHAELLTPDLPASTGFFTEVLGMGGVARDSASAHLRGYGQYQLADLQLTAAETPGLGHLGLRAGSQPGLERCVADLPLRTWTAAHRAPDPRLGATHTIEVPVVFGTHGQEIGARVAGSGPSPHAVSEAMMSAWREFIHGRAPWDEDQERTF